MEVKSTDPDVLQVMSAADTIVAPAVEHFNKEQFALLTAMVAMGYSQGKSAGIKDALDLVRGKNGK